jgi:hypothetical protein
VIAIPRFVSRTRPEKIHCSRRIRLLIVSPYSRESEDVTLSATAIMPNAHKLATRRVVTVCFIKPFCKRLDKYPYSAFLMQATPIMSRRQTLKR